MRSQTPETGNSACVFLQRYHATALSNTHFGRFSPQNRKPLVHLTATASYTTVYHTAFAPREYMVAITNLSIPTCNSQASFELHVESKWIVPCTEKQVNNAKSS